ncbi:Inosine/uridine-preferring nucleoside hydrolase domain-containing protein [Cristinia sonorae]|uniref:Inosine/uridine-preferring nucleoside hydrolase domain-containing protein n=1 Tax=Cristinia sonorae TaxID=1940300 RepID=A0A8K0UMG0_9AGAR|nr:Inosine/uridine-preferring nucleoside hydrolase domain-containing protein [Cristinia sonorae]
MTTKYIWLDCDPGHDDATTIMLALNCPEITLLGVSTVHGNSSARHTHENAARCLVAFGAPPDVKVYPGAIKPLIRAARHDPEIHGVDGLGGVENLPPISHPLVQDALTHLNKDGKAIHGIACAVRETWKEGSGSRITLISTGPMTNIALFVSIYPELLEGIDEFVFMGGGVGLGNRSSSAEFNILCDPEAAQIALDAPVKKIMIPLNVTHTAIVTRSIQSRLLNPTHPLEHPEDPLPEASTPLRYTLSTLITFFAETYESTFGFTLGPPLHDALTIAYIVHPEMFSCRRFRVDVELSGAHTAGETVVDMWGYRKCDNTWGSTGKNCVVAESLNVEAFFDFFLECVARCDLKSPLNNK